MLSNWTTINKKATMKDRNIIIEVKEKLKGLLPLKKLKFQVEPRIDNIMPDFVADVSINEVNFKLIGEIIERESSSIFQKRISQLKFYENQKSDYVPILIDRYLIPKKREYCKKNKINYLDLSGNVYLSYKNIYIEKTGFINQYPELRKKRSPFSDKASLILRLMLGGNKVWGVREIAHKVSLDAGYVSRMFKELEKRNYLIRKNGKGKLQHQNELLNDWADFYDYKENKENKFFCLSKGPEGILDKLKNIRISKEIEYALSFQAGAFLVSPFAVYNDVHIYISNKKSFEFFVDKLKLKSVEKGANFFILHPYYRHSIFNNKQKVQNLWVVSDLQLYLDLYKYPQRGLEQAEHLYEKRLKKMIEAG
jgi:DNA-binding transcriptional regulator YhcF (GntR family)